MTKAKYLTAALQSYEWVIAYDDKHHLNIMEKEIKLSREMVAILPAKINALKTGQMK